MAAIEKRVYDGNRAKEILDNDVFQQVFDDIQQELYKAWADSPARDSQGREKIHQYLAMLNKVKSHLITTLETGRLATLELQHKQTLLDQAKHWLKSDADS